MHMYNEREFRIQMQNVVGNFKRTLKIIGFNTLTIYQKTEYFVGGYT